MAKWEIGRNPTPGVEGVSLYLHSLLTMCLIIMQAIWRFNYQYSLELFMSNKNCIYLNGASNGFSNFTSQLLRVKILCRDRDLLRGAGTAGGDLQTVTLTMNHFSVSPRHDAPEDKSSPDPRPATREQRKQKRSHQFRSSLIPKIVELFIQHWHRV